MEFQELTSKKTVRWYAGMVKAALDHGVSFDDLVWSTRVHHGDEFTGLVLADLRRRIKA